MPGLGPFTSTQNVNCGTPASLSNLLQSTWFTWSMVTGTPAVASTVEKNTGTTVGRLFRLLQTSTSAALTIGRATGSAVASATHANFAAYGANKRVFFAATIDTTTGLPKLYMGDLYMPCAEPAAYASQTLGSGSIGDDTGAPSSLYIGNGGSSLTRPFPGVVFVAGLLNRVLELSDLVELQFKSLDPAFNPFGLPGLVGFWRPGEQGDGWVQDYSGRGNHGLVTAAPSSGLILNPNPPQRSVSRLMNPRFNLGA